MTTMKNAALPKREDIPAEARWHLDDIYKTAAEWQAARDGITKTLAEIQKFRGRLSEPQALLDCLTKQDEMEITLSAVFAWARMMADTDTGNQEYQAAVLCFFTKVRYTPIFSVSAN